MPQNTSAKVGNRFQYTLYNLDPASNYEFEITPRNEHGAGTAAPVTAVTETGNIVTPPPSDQTPGQALPTVMPTPAAHNVRLVSIISYTLDVNDSNHLRINIAGATWESVNSIAFTCNFDDDGTFTVLDDDDAVDYVDPPQPARNVRAQKVADSGRTVATGADIIVSSRVEQDATCLARAYRTVDGTGDYLETNHVRLRWQPEGRTLFRKEEAFLGTPGGSATWLFIPPVFFGIVIAGATRNAGATLLAVAVAFGVAVWFTESPPILWALVAITAASGVLLMLQLGFRGR